MLSIEQIRPELTWRLRKEVLYPTEPLYAMEMEEDQQGYHFGAYQNDDLIAVVSLFQKDADYQFRKFAVLPAYQSKGIGTLLLNHVSQFASAGGGSWLWCNARLSATGFYLKLGFVIIGNEFVKNNIGYVIMGKNI